jgi:hypothetical protein
MERGIQMHSEKKSGDYYVNNTDTESLGEAKVRLSKEVADLMILESRITDLEEQYYRKEITEEEFDERFKKLMGWVDP